MCLNASSTQLPAVLGDLLDRAAPRRHPSPAPVADATPTTEHAMPARRARAKLWQLDRKFHCLIVGTCLSAAELARLGRRFPYLAGPSNEYRQHVEAVGCCDSRNEVSQALQRLLDQRHGAALTAFAEARDEAAVLARWNDCLARGDVAGPLWATVSHKHAGDAVRQSAYEAVHMLSHQVGAGLAADVRRLAFLDRENARLRGELAGERATLARRAELSAEEHGALKAELAKARGENAILVRARERLERLENGVTMIALARELMALKHDNRALQAAVARGEALAARLGELEDALATQGGELAQLRQERGALERLLLDGVETPAPEPAPVTVVANCAGDCLRCAEQHGLSRIRCILCVGGRTSLLSHYRALAQRLGIELLHHDGGQEAALSRLPELIASADAVLCPTDAVSHAAYYSLKQQCRKSGKPCLLFKGAGVTSFAFALSRLTAGESTLPTTGGEALQNSRAVAA